VLCHLGTLTKSNSATIVIRVLQTSAGISPIDLMNARRRTGTPGGTAGIASSDALPEAPASRYDQKQALKPDEVALAARASKVSAVTEVAAQFLPGVGNKQFFQVGARKEWTRFHIPVTELISLLSLD
jgi:hypothetical protein